MIKAEAKKTTGTVTPAAMAAVLEVSLGACVGSDDGAGSDVDVADVEGGVGTGDAEGSDDADVKDDVVVLATICVSPTPLSDFLLCYMMRLTRLLGQLRLTYFAVTTEHFQSCRVLRGILGALCRNMLADYAGELG